MYAKKGVKGEWVEQRQQEIQKLLSNVNEVRRMSRGEVKILI